MISYLTRSRSVKTILVEKTDRLYRNFEDAVRLGSLGVDIHFVKEGTVFNRETRSSEKLQHDLKLVIAKNYIDNLSEETRKGLMEKARQGLWPTVAPLGYLNDRDSGAIVPDPDRAHLVRRLFEAYATGRHSLASLVNLAWEMGLRSKKGNKVGKSTIAAMLAKPVYMGEFEWQGERFIGTHEPIVSRELFAQVTERRTATTHGRQRKHSHPFKGLLRCGVCGCLVTAETKFGKYTYYHCTHGRGDCDEKSVREKALAEMLGEHLKRLSLTPERVAWIVDHIKEDDAERQERRQEERSRLTKDKAELERKLDLIYEDKLTGAISEEFCKRKRDELTVRLRWIEGEIAALDSDQGVDLAQAERIIEITQRAYSLYLTRNRDEQRKLADLLLSKPVLKGRTVSAAMRHPFDLIADGAEEDRAKAARGEPILAENRNWLPE